MAIGMVIAGTVASSVIGGLMQGNAAQDAANAQTQAAQQQAAVQAGMYNASQMNLMPSRELGGLAQQREAYLMGLTPNLDISPSYTMSQVSPGGQVSYYGPGASNVNSTYGIPQTQPTLPVALGMPGMSLTGPGAMPGSAGGGSTPFAPVSTSGAPPNAGGMNPISGTPNTGAGGGGYGSLGTPYSPSSFFLSPDFQFQMQQGNLALQRAQSASGHNLGGAAIKDYMQFGTGLASQDYNQAFSNSLNSQAQQYNMLQGAITGGQVATAGSNAAGTSAAAGLGSAYTGAGNAAAAGSIGQANATTGAINGIGNAITSGALATSNPNSPFYNPMNSFNFATPGSNVNVPGAGSGTFQGYGNGSTTFAPVS